MKLDFATKIDGYSNMTAEQKIAAVEAFEHEVDYTGYVKKDLFDGKASEVSKLSQKAKELEEQLKTRMTPEEAKAQLEAEIKQASDKEKQELIERLERLETEKENATNRAYVIGKLKLTDKEAETIADGVKSDVFAKIVDGIAKSFERQEREGKEQRANQQGAGSLPAGRSDGNKSKSEFAAFQEKKQANSGRVELQKDLRK